jgi:hypothetical protein
MGKQKMGRFKLSYPLAPHSLFFEVNKGTEEKENTPVALKTIDLGYQPLWTGPASVLAFNSTFGGK